MTREKVDVEAILRNAFKVREEDTTTSDERREVMEQRKLYRSMKNLLDRIGETLAMYIALPAVEPLHASNAQWRIADGANQTTKTSFGAIETARCACWCDPYDKYKKEPGRIQIVGLTERHLANPLYAKLFKPGAFSQIRDEHTKLWRIIRWKEGDPTTLDPYDEAYREKWKDTPPIIPERMVKTTAWCSKAKEVPAKVRLINGMDLEFVSSEAPEHQGTQWVLGWFDEQLKREAHLTEFARGAMRFNAKAIWSATPQTMNAKLLDLRERFEAGDEEVMAVRLFPEDNPFISKEAQEQFVKFLSDEEIAIRRQGQYAINARKIYQFQGQTTHGYEPREIPKNWARYCSLDPARRNAGTVFAAVPPDESHVYIYDAFETTFTDNYGWAGQVAERMDGVRFQAFIIDKRCGRQTNPGNDITVAEKYFEALEERGVAPIQHGPLKGFFPGSDDVRAREETLKSWLVVRSSGPFAGTAKLLVARGRCLILDRQLKLSRTEEHDPTKRYKQTEDVLDALEYLAAFNPRYMRPETIAVKSQGNLDPRLAKILKRNRRRRRYQEVV